MENILSRNKTKDPLPTKLRDNINAIDITNKLDIANTLNNFFTSIGRNLAQNINYTGDKNHRYYLKTNHKKVFTFKEIEQESITMVINSLPNKSSVEIDGISTILLKCIAPFIIKPLTLYKINEWLQINKLSLNANKSRFMIFCMPNKYITLPILQISNTNIEKVNEFNFLGLTLDIIKSRSSPSTW